MITSQQGAFQKKNPSQKKRSAALASVPNAADISLIKHHSFKSKVALSIKQGIGATIPTRAIATLGGGLKIQ
jgi:hypothetical protein